MPSTCCIVGCSKRAERDDVKFYRIPKIQNNKWHDISKRRQEAWLRAINRKDLVKNNLLYTHVCANHFINGKSAATHDELNPDWVPSINLGYSVKTSQKPLSRYQRGMKRSLIKTKLSETAVKNPPSPSYPDEDEEMPSHETVEQFTQTEDFYIAEGADQALLKKYNALVVKNARLQEEVVQLKDKMRKKTTWDDLQSNDKMCKYLTGFPDFAKMEVIYKEVESCLPICKSGKLSKFDTFLITFMKIRLDLPFTYLSYQYGVAVSTLSRSFHVAIKIIYSKLCCLVFWPNRKASIENSPPVFKQYFGPVPVFIIDCFEVLCERPGKMLARAKTFSHYKHHQTLKYLIAISSYGNIVFISKAYGGRCSDKFVVENSGFLDRIAENDIILADRGFLISSSVAAKRAKLIMPAFKNSRSQLQPLEVESSRKIASLRIHVERVIGVLRQKFLILTNRQPITAISKRDSQKMFVDYIMSITCAVINCSSSIIPNS